MGLFGSLRARIMAGFVALLGLFIAGFAGALHIAQDFRTADAERIIAVDQLRRSGAIDGLAHVAQGKLSDYLRTGSVEARAAMTASFLPLSKSLADDSKAPLSDSLTVQSAVTVATIDAAALAARHFTDTAASLSNPSAAIGRSVAFSTDPALIAAASRLQASIGAIALAAARLAQTGDAKIVEEIDAERIRILAAAAEIDGHPAASARLRKLTNALSRVMGAFDRSLTNLSQALDKRVQGSIALNSLLQQTADAASAKEVLAGARFDAAAKRASDASDFLLSALLMIAGLVCAAGIVLAIVLGASISRPIVALKQAIAQIAAGDFAVVIPGLGRHDEIGQMARAVGIFRDNGLRLTRTEASNAEAAQHQMHVVEAIGVGLERLAVGKLAFRLTDAFPSGYEKLQHDFNGALEKLQHVMAAVSTNTFAIRSGTSEISSASDDLLHRTEQQSVSLAGTAASLDRIATTVRTAAAGARHARAVVGSAKMDTERSAQVVHHAIHAMGGIETSSGEIGQIVGVIERIASQTNLLALNAAVEAARAGEAGRGFGVVASEVRELAKRSAQAAQDIKVLISASGQHVSQGVDLVGQTGAALERIRLKVVEINDVITSIAASAEMQATSLDEVNVAINQIDRDTQQNAAMVQETTAASHALARETEELGQLVGRFEVGQVHGAGRDSDLSIFMRRPVADAREAFSKGRD